MTSPLATRVSSGNSSFWPRPGTVPCTTAVGSVEPHGVEVPKRFQFKEVRFGQGTWRPTTDDYDFTGYQVYETHYEKLGKVDDVFIGENVTPELFEEEVVVYKRVVLKEEILIRKVVVEEEEVLEVTRARRRST